MVITSRCNIGGRLVCNHPNSMFPLKVKPRSDAYAVATARFQFHKGRTFTATGSYQTKRKKNKKNKKNFFATKLKEIQQLENKATKKYTFKISI